MGGAFGMKAISVGLSASLLSIANAKVVIEAMKHDIQLVTPQNFDGVISKFRDSAVSSVWYFNEANKADIDLMNDYNKVAVGLKGMAKVSALNCAEFKMFCDKNGVKETPHVQIYPPNPVPAFKYEGKLEEKAIFGKIARYMTDMSTKLTKDIIDTFVTTDPTKPKVLLFSNKKTVPMIWKALSSETVFRRTIKFGFVTEEEADAVQKFKVTKYP